MCTSCVLVTQRRKIALLLATHKFTIYAAGYKKIIVNTDYQCVLLLESVDFNKMGYKEKLELIKDEGYYSPASE